MSVFRVEKNKNYTVMSNYHLKDKNLSLKTKGLLSIMLSLPEDWDYTEIGLTKITGEGRSSIRSCLQQLEEYGYLVRSQSNDANGRFSKAIYTIYESPDLRTDHPLSDFPTTVNPTSEEPTSDDTTSAGLTSVSGSTDNPTADNPTQLNNIISNTDPVNTDLSITQSSNPDGPMDGSVYAPSAADLYRAYEAQIRENVKYDLFLYKNQRIEEQFTKDEIDLDDYEMTLLEYDLGKLDAIIRYMTDFLCSPSSEPVEVNGDLIPREIVKSKLMKVDYHQMKTVIKKLMVARNIKNPKKYTISMLYNI